jgi:hypothetical protein
VNRHFHCCVREAFGDEAEEHPLRDTFVWVWQQKVEVEKAMHTTLVGGLVCSVPPRLPTCAR